MQSLVENARRIFDVAKAAADAEPQNFAVLINADGGLHFVMESTFSLDGAAADVGAQSAFQITRTLNGIRVTARGLGNSGQFETCVVEERNPWRELLPDQPFYRITSPRLISGSAAG